MGFAKICFGMPSAFCGDSEYCQECKLYKECALAVSEKLNELDVPRIKKLIKNHNETMVKIGLLKESDVKPTRKTTKATKTEKNDVLANALKFYETSGLCSKGFISEDLSKAPEVFACVSKYIRLGEKVKQEDILRNVKFTLPLLVDYIAETALAVQVLAANGIIKVNKASIRWIGTKQ